MRHEPKTDSSGWAQNCSHSAQLKSLLLWPVFFVGTNGQEVIHRCRKITCQLLCPVIVFSCVMRAHKLQNVQAN